MHQSKACSQFVRSLRICSARDLAPRARNFAHITSVKPCFSGSTHCLVSNICNANARRLAHTNVAQSTETTSNDSTTQGEVKKHEFQAETKMLLDIVAKSLYSEKEVFVRELISNCSDALEKLRYNQLIQQNETSANIISSSSSEDTSTLPELKITISVDKLERTFTIQDNGIGFNRNDLITNLGTIAKSGSKAFIEEISSSKGTGSGISGQEQSHNTMDTILGKFGVGFYSAFMVADKVEVFTKTHVIGSQGLRWYSDGSGTFEVSNVDAVPGTKIVLHLKSDCLEFADEKRIEDVIKKYSDFVNFPITLNGKLTNSLQALWTLDSKAVTEQMHDEFYRYISKQQTGKPRYVLHYKTDAPINIRALLYVPETKPTMIDLAQSSDTGIALYCRRVLIQSKTNEFLPKWMRFMKGVIDSEDIPLNLSRELLQQTSLIRKLKNTISGRVIKFFKDKMKLNPASYEEFFKDYGIFFKEGIVTNPDQVEKEALAELLLFESSSQRPGVLISLKDYSSRMQAGQRDIYYLCAPSRELAESSPYYEAFKEKSLEILFCYEPYDELSLMQLGQFDRKQMTSVESQVHKDKSEQAESKSDETEGEMSKEESTKIIDWIKSTMGNKVWEVKTTTKLTTYPCMITVDHMGAARHFIRTELSGISDDQRYMLLRPTLELNLSHPIIVKLGALRDSEPETAKLLLEQVYDNALVAAGLMENPRTMVTRLNTLLTKIIEKV